MSTFRDNIRTQTAKIRDTAGVLIVYSRDTESVVIPRAIKFPGRRQSTMDVVAIDSAIQNWGIAVDDLVLSGSLATPARGDVITFTEEGVTATYEVLPQDGDSVSHLTAGDSQHYIHTKQLT